jgi:hypothetical protein
MNLGKALTYPFEDKQWASKMGLGLLISIIPILNFAWVGYIIEIMRQVMKGEPLPMPGWDNLGKKFMDGLILALAGLVYALPIILLVGIPLTIMIVPAVLAGYSSTQDVANAIAAAGGVAFMCLTCVFLLYGLALSVVMPAISIEYANKGTFAACFNFREIFGQVGKNPGAFFTAWGVYLGVTIGASLAAGIVGGLLGWIPCLGQLVAVVVSFAASIYALLVYAHLFGQYGAIEAVGVPPATA